MIISKGGGCFDLPSNCQDGTDIGKRSSLDDWQSVTDPCLQQGDDTRYKEDRADHVGQICSENDML